MAAVTFTNITKRYKDGPKAVDDLNLEIADGESSNSSIAAARKVTNSPADSCPARDCHSAMLMTIDRPIAAISWVSGVPADAATCIFIAKRRSLPLMSAKRPRSYSKPS